MTPREIARECVRALVAIANVLAWGALLALASGYALILVPGLLLRVVYALLVVTSPWVQALLRGVDPGSW